MGGGGRWVSSHMEAETPVWHLLGVGIEHPCLHQRTGSFSSSLEYMCCQRGVYFQHNGSVEFVPSGYPLCRHKNYTNNL